ncbi:methyl-accepting chemotaxis protein [Paenibacillus sp. DS2015]|uniref:methyl-accepting chemotaxis protein n=1 Tax=Paenibacillus sp. DS2015 TaxID=3373917 RepID=UPI003D24399B
MTLLLVEEVRKTAKKDKLDTEHRKDIQIITENKNEIEQPVMSSVAIDTYSRAVATVNSETTCRNVMNILRDRPEYPCLVIIDEDNRPKALVMRDAFNRRLMGRFAADLYEMRHIHAFANYEALVMDIRESASQLIEQALNRPEKHFYDCVILVDQGQFKGVLTVQDLMMVSGRLKFEAEESRKLTVKDNYGHVENIEASLLQVADAANRTIIECRNMKEWSLTGKTKLEEVQQSYNSVVESLTSRQYQVSKLLQDVGVISKLTQDIAEVAGRSGLLALNATIEAAHAGEYGRGFQVVASEVRVLAQHTRHLAEDISSLLNNIRSIAIETSESTTIGMLQIQESAMDVSEGSRIFGEMEQVALSVEYAGEVVHQLAEATAKQAANVRKELGNDCMEK